MRLPAAGAIGRRKAEKAIEMPGLDPYLREALEERQAPPNPLPPNPVPTTVIQTSTTTSLPTTTTTTTTTTQISSTTQTSTTIRLSSTSKTTSTVLPTITGHPASGTDHNESQSNAQIGVIVGVSFGILLCFSLFLLLGLRWLRIRGSEPKFLPSATLKRLWREWTPGKANPSYSTSLQTPRPRTPSRSSSNVLGMMRTSTAFVTANQSRDRVNDDVDRRQSVRSVLTLPAYSEDVRPTEKILGREGEREGIDTVVEFPETGEELEARRDEEMESLYQIRRARREEREAREQRREQRREARERGDRVTLQQLRQESARQRQASVEDMTTSEVMIAEHQGRNRGRRVSSVDYADIGLARHDGSRVRASSNDSDRPLLDAAAPQGRRGSGQAPQPPYLHAARGQSTSSLRFITPDYSDDDDHPHGSTSEFELVQVPSSRHSRDQSGSRPVTPRLRSLTNDSSQSTAEPGLPHPPQYEDVALRERVRSDQPVSPVSPAPPYESPTDVVSPVSFRGSMALPSIEITPFSPVLGDDEDDSQEQRRDANET